MSETGLFGLPTKSRQIGIISALFILFAVPVTIVATLQTRSAITKAAICTDIDGDGVISSQDASLLSSQILAGSFSAESDFNKDKKLNGDDLSLINDHLGEVCIPKISFFIDPDTIKAGESATMTWSVDHVSTVTIEGIGVVKREGKTLLLPTQEKTYKLTATGPGGTIVATSTVKITP